MADQVSVSFPPPTGTGGKLYDAVSVVTYGADPTGSVDSLAAVNAAAAALSGTGVRLYVPGGTYQFSAVPTLPAGTLVELGSGITTTGTAAAAAHAALIAHTADGAIDFVRDCGADPSGTNDIAPALDVAYGLLKTQLSSGMSAGPLVLRLRPGYYALKSNPVSQTWDFNANNTSLIVEGSGDSTVIAFYGYSWPTMANMLDVTVRSLACYGPNNTGSGIDCQLCFAVNPARTALFDHCYFFNLAVNYAVVYAQGEHIVWRACRMINCAPIPGSGAYACLLVNNCQSVRLLDSVFIDVGSLNGLPESNKVGGQGNNGWFQWAPLSSVTCQYMLIEGCMWDENARSAIALMGTSANPLMHCRIVGNYFNPCIQGASGDGPNIIAQYVQRLDVEGYYNSGYNTTATSQLANLTHVGRATFKRVATNPAAVAQVIAADGTCNSVHVEDGDALVLTNLASSAPVTTWQGTINAADLDALADVRSSGAAIAANALVKPSSGGVVTMATTDDAGACLGVCLDAVASSGKNIRVARFGQTVTVLNDGGAAISIGDKIIPSATTAGEVTHTSTAGADYVGIALTAAAATAGTAFTILLKPGRV